MADTKISGLAAVTDVLSTDEFVLARSGTTKKIDAVDLVSAFGGGQLDYVEFTSNVTISATTPASANTLVTGSSVTYDGSTVVIVELYAFQALTGEDGGIGVVLFDGSTELGIAAFVGGQTAGAGTSTWSGPLSIRRKLTPSSGAHTYSWRAYRSVINGTVNAGNGTAGNGMPGFIRITRV